MIRLDVVWERIGDWFFATVTDPGNLRLHSAIKSFLAVALSVLVLVALAFALKLSLIGALFGSSLTQQGVMLMDKKEKPSELWISALVVTLAGVLTAVIGLLLASDRVLSQIGFVAMLVIATYVRRFGMRGTLTSLTIFGAYLNFAVLTLLSPHLLPPVAQWPWIACCIAVCIVCGMLVAFIIRDRPEQNVRHLLSTLNKRIEDVMAVVSEALRQNAVNRRSVRRLRTRLIWLDDTEMLLQRQIDSLDARALPDHINHEKFKRDLLDIELAAEELGRTGMASAIEEMAPESRVIVLGALESLRGALCEKDSGEVLQHTMKAVTTLASHDLIDTLDGHRLVMAIEHLASALLKLHTQVEIADGSRPIANSGWSPAPVSSNQPSRAVSTPVSQVWSLERLFFWKRMDLTARQACQVLIATTLAAVIGNMVSTPRVYWAILGAYIAIAGTHSRLASLHKGFHRVIGTLLGVLIGTFVTSLVAGNLIISALLIMLCFFMVIYWGPVNYSIMVIFVTTMLALLYGLLGEFSIQLLALRLEETALGVFFGVLAALFILPVSTYRTLNTDMQKFLTNLEQLIDSAVSHLMGASVPAASLIAQVRKLKPQLQALRQHTMLLNHGLLMEEPHRLQKSILVFMSCEHYARALISVVNQTDTASLSPALEPMLMLLAEQVHVHIEALKATLADPYSASVGCFESQLKAVEDIDLDSDERSYQSLLQAVHALRQIDQAVILLTCDYQGIPHTVESGRH